MRKPMVRKLAYVVLLVLLASPVEGAFASSAGQTTNSTSSSPGPTANDQGITGTDPEPISPTIVSIIFTLLQLS